MAGWLASWAACESRRGLDGSRHGVTPAPPPHPPLDRATHRDSVNSAVWRAVHCSRERHLPCACAVALTGPSSALQRTTTHRPGCGGAAGAAVGGGGFGAERRVRPSLSGRGWLRCPQSREPAFPPYFFSAFSPLPHVLSPALRRQLTPLPRCQLQRAENTMDGTQSRRHSRIGSR